MSELVRSPEANGKGTVRSATSLETKNETGRHRRPGVRLDYPKLVIKETLRLHPAAPLQENAGKDVK